MYELLINYFRKVLPIHYGFMVLHRRINNILNHKNNIKEIKKKLDNLDFNEYHKKKRKIPSRTSIEINNTCNLNCIMCNTKSSKRPFGDMNFSTFENILKQLRDLGFNSIALHTVGEPFLFKNLSRLFQIIKKYNFKVSLSTNGQFPNRLNNLIQLYSDVLKRIRFSIDGAKPGTYEKIRRGASYNKLIESLEIIYKFNRSKINYKIDVKIDSILSLTNIYEIPLFFKVFGKYCWPEFINFHLINGLSPDTKYFWEAFPFPNLIRHMVPCDFPFRNIYFTYDGKVTLCCRDYDGDLIVGDLKEESLIDIWNGENSEDIRKQHLNLKKLTIDACKRCYGAHFFAIEIVNDFIHYLHYNHSEISPEEFGKNILSLLKDMDQAMEKKDRFLLKQKIIKHFIKS
ncbi:MAG: radical SAM/SPASM domain-containing protein [Promethearchaeota archaeon]